MKQKIIFLILSLPFLAHSQSRLQVLVSGRGGSGTTNGVKGYANADEIRSSFQATNLPLQNTIYFLEDKPGDWRYDANDDSSSDNTGTVIVTDNGARIKRVIDNGILYVDWFNVEKGEIDDAPGVNAAFQYAKDNLATIHTIQFGVGEYRFVTAIDTIDFQCTIGGAYFNHIAPATQWWFYGNTPGIVIRAAVTMKNIYLRKVFYGGGYNSEFDGIDISTEVHFEGVVVSGFPGDGFNIHGDGSGATENADHSTFMNSKSHLNMGHGWVLYGGDANIIQFLNCEAVANGGSGWLDNGFLGNQWINCHTAANGSPETSIQNVLCSYSPTPGDTLLYYALHNADPQGRAGTLGVPGVALNDWALHPGQHIYAWVHSPYVKEYHPDSLYLAGGGYVLDTDNEEGSNQFSTLFGCYSEGDNPPSRWGPKSLSIGGDLRPAGIYSGLEVASYNTYMDISTGFQVHYTDNLPFLRIQNDALVVHRSAVDNTGGAFQYNIERSSIGWRDYATYSPNSDIATSGGSEILFPNALGSALGRSTNDFAWNTINPTLFLDDANTAGRNYKQISMGNSPPLSGTYSTGDIRFRVVNTTGQSIGWRCVAGGTPGTWEEMTGSSGVNAADYTPTEVDITNIATSTARVTEWMRIGDYIHVSGSITITTTLASTLSTIDVSLPVASEVDSKYDISGTCASETVFGTVYGNTTNDRARISFTSPASGSPGDVTFNFIYKVIQN